MQVIEGKDVDLLKPFPLMEVPRLIGWLHCYKTIIHSDDSPQTEQELKDYFTTWLQQPNVVSWGIIDKNRKLNIRHEAPLVGFGGFAYSTLRDGYFHCATTRRAWGTGMIDEAGRLAIRDLFTTDPRLTRVSTIVINNNYPARSLAHRLGFVIEGRCEDMVVQKGIPRPVTHFGLTRRAWLAAQAEAEQPSTVDTPAQAETTEESLA